MFAPYHSSFTITGNFAGQQALIPRSRNRFRGVLARILIVQRIVGAVNVAENVKWLCTGLVLALVYVVVRYVTNI